MRRVVVLPAPFGPRRPRTWPFSTPKERSRTAYRSVEPAYRLPRPVIRSGTSASSGSGAGAVVLRRPVTSRTRASTAPVTGSHQTHAGSGAAAVSTPGAVGTVRPLLRETVYVAGSAGEAYPRSVEERARRSRWPFCASWSTAGRVSSTSLPSLASSTRTGATSWAGRTCCLPSGPTSYTFAKSTASLVEDFTWTRTFGVPVMRRSPPSGSESNAANCPGKSRETPTPSEDSRESEPPPRPGSEEIAGGLAPAGLSMVFSRPPSGTSRPPLTRPG